jgi:hypothetical protein
VNQLTGHHTGAGHDGATEPVDAPPVADEGERARNADEAAPEDDVETGWEFECPVCDRTFDTETELSNHRSGKCAPLPDHVSEADFEEIVAEADILLEVQRALRVSRGQARGLLGRFDLADQVNVNAGATAQDPDTTDAVLEDGGSKAGDTAASAICQNCGSQVTAQYARVFAPGGDPRVCPECEDKTRTPDGSVRDRRDRSQHLGGDEA